MRVVPVKTLSSASAGPFADALINSNVIAAALANGDRLVFANAGFNAMFGLAGDPAGASIFDLLLPRHKADVRAAMLAPDGPSPDALTVKALRGRTSTFDVELRFERVMVEREPMLAVFAQDVSNRSGERDRFDAEARRDPLTGLGNRAMFDECLRRAAMTVRRSGRSFAVLLLDLDGFKAINEQKGRDAGDRVLKRIAARMLATMRDIDTVARLGGDAFAILMPDVDTRTEVTNTADSLLTMSKQPVDIGGRDVMVGASIGIALFPEHSALVEHLLAAAERGLLVAKRRGRGQIAWATPASISEIVPAPLVWDATHNVGFPEIDSQHATLAALINILIGALQKSEAHAMALNAVIRYTEFHFATEERLMLSHHYGGASAHRDMHQRLLDELRELRLDGAGVKINLTIGYLGQWLLRHVDGADRDMAAALRAAGTETARRE